MSKDSQSAANVKQPQEKGEMSFDGNQPVANVGLNELVQKEKIDSLDSQSAASIKQPLENEEKGKTSEININEQRKMSHACEQSFGATNGIPLGDTVGTARMEERKPQLEDELEQLRTKEEFTNFIKKYFAIKQEEVDSLNTELANVRETLQAKIEELIYAYDQECSLRLQINGMQHGEKSKDPNQNMEESSTQTEDREYLLNKKIEALEGVKKVQAERIKELKMELHAYKQSSNVPNGVPLGDTIGKVRELEMSGLAMDELDHSPLHLELEQLSIQGGEDNEDGHGPNRAQDTDNFKQENSSTLPRFRREYYCPTSCVSRVISFIFDQMRLPVCNTRLHKEVQKDLCSLSKFPDVDCEVGECSLAFKDFHDVGLIEKQHMFLAKIENAEERGRRLKEAIDTMEGESHPALFIMHYELYQDGKKRDGHSLAIMPNGEFIQVKEKRQWKPEQDQLWKSVTQIEVWKVEKKTAEDWEKKCGWKKCTRACIYSRNRKEKHT